jgi:hypothetical protein
MKKLLLVILASASISSYAQKFGQEFGLNYLYAKPMGNMGHIIQQGHGVAGHYGFVMPKSRFAFGLETAYAQYGRDKSQQQYNFADGSVVPMDIIVSNSFLNIMAYSRFYLATEGMLRPYLTGKLGYSAYSTNLNIYDPDDFDHCEPVDSEVLYNDGTMVATAGAGLKVDLGLAFKKLPRGMFYLEGGQVRYMNTDAPTHSHHGTTPDGNEVTAEFRNTQTQIIHQHHVGYLYQSPVQMTEFSFGITMNISPRE